MTTSPGRPLAVGYKTYYPAVRYPRPVPLSVYESQSRGLIRVIENLEESCWQFVWEDYESVEVLPIAPEKFDQEKVNYMKEFNETIEQNMLKGLGPLTVTSTLDTRGKSYGSFADNAKYAQKFMYVLEEARHNRALNGQDPMTPTQYNAMVMICQKMSRLLAGDSSHEDSWHDIAGYAELGRKPR